MKWWLVLLLMLSIGINVGLLLSRAWPDKPAPPLPAPEAPPTGFEHLPPVIHRLLDRLRLDEERRQKFLGHQRRFLSRTIAARGRVAELQRELRRELTAPEPDRDHLDELLAELNAMHGELERAFVDNLLDSRALLDGEQEKTFMHFMGRLRGQQAEPDRDFRGRPRMGRRQPPDGRHPPPERRWRPPGRESSPPRDAVPDQPEL